MQSIQGYYDGMSIIPLEEVNAKPNQRVIITVTEEFVEHKKSAAIGNMRGVLSKYADPESAKKEEGAWERAAAEKHKSAGTRPS